MAEFSGGMRCDPGGAGSEVDEGSEIEVDTVVDTGNEGKANDKEWRIVNWKKMKRKQRESDGEKGEELSSEIKVILRFQSPCTSNPLKVSDAIYKLVGEVRLVKTLRDGNLLIICSEFSGKD